MGNAKVYWHTLKKPISQVTENETISNVKLSWIVERQNNKKLTLANLSGQVLGIYCIRSRCSYQYVIIMINVDALQM